MAQNKGWKRSISLGALNAVIDGDIDRLYGAFLWADAPEGHEYWSKCQENGKLTKSAKRRLKAMLKEVTEGAGETP